jgi:hypothetical protein
MDWQQKTAEQAYMMMYTHEVEYRLMNNETMVEKFVRWQGETGDVYTGQFAVYLEGSESPRILDNDAMVLVRVIELVSDEQTSPLIDTHAAHYDEADYYDYDEDED